MATFKGDGSKEESVSGGTKFSHGDEAQGRAQARQDMADMAFKPLVADPDTGEITGHTKAEREAAKAALSLFS